jgi:hypothetical protein
LGLAPVTAEGPPTAKHQDELLAIGDHPNRIVAPVQADRKKLGLRFDPSTVTNRRQDEGYGSAGRCAAGSAPSNETGILGECA